ncbi:C40 family peptidase [Gangjinia marincola]|uniref:C40 family peptidase n=1 Tax=Gangjinia marincola TaxID=578463 RepID=A0ABN1MF89_9FLAO
MQYGICPLSIVPLRFEPHDPSEMVTQVLYGEFFKVLEQRKKWSKIRLAYDQYEGWIDDKQYLEITKEEFSSLQKITPKFTADLMDFVYTEQEQLISIPLGATVSSALFLKHLHEGNITTGKQGKVQLITTALLYQNTPYLWGGKTTSGIDCSGFTQMVYKINGYSLLRDASQQATQGEALSFIEESEPGDLAFFDNKEGNIIHVGIIMKDNYIIHAHGKVRIDRIDHTGIFNTETKEYSHQLRVIKKII